MYMYLTLLNGDKFIINLNAVSDMRADDNGTLINFTNGLTERVQESMDTIMWRGRSPVL
jgi:uncharacterized protein YlzI (FlbEa/FlbD family)